MLCVVKEQKGRHRFVYFTCNGVHCIRTVRAIDIPAIRMYTDFSVRRQRNAIKYQYVYKIYARREKTSAQIKKKESREAKSNSSSISVRNLKQGFVWWKKNGKKFSRRSGIVGKLAPCDDVALINTQCTTKVLLASCPRTICIHLHLRSI